jgi:hypothetical protein
VGININAINKNVKTVTDTSKEVDLEVSTEKTKYMFMSNHKNAGKNRNKNIATISTENVVKLKYLGMTVTNDIFS